MSDEELLTGFAEKGRYNIRLAQKRGVATRWVRANEACSEERNTKKETETCPPEKGGEGGFHEDKTCIEAFYDLLDQTTKRDWFAHNSLQYYKNFVEVLEKNNAGGLLFAEKEWVLHAAGIFVFSGLPWNLSPTLSEGEGVSPPWGM